MPTVGIGTELAFAACLYVLGQFLGSIRAYTWVAVKISPLYVRFAAKLMEFVAICCFMSAAGNLMGFDVNGISERVVTSGSVAIGFASQDVLKNLAAGLVIMATKPFEVRDKITCDGKTGIVVEVGFFATKLKTSDETGLLLPNSKVAGCVMINETHTFGVARSGMHRVNILFHLSIQADLELADKVLKEVGLEMNEFIKKMNQSDYKHGQTVDQYHAETFGQNIQDECNRFPAKTAIVGQNIAAGMDIALYCFVDEVLLSKVKAEAFKRGLRAFKKAKVELFDPNGRLDLAR